MSGAGAARLSVPDVFAVGDTFDVGEDCRTPVSPTYKVPFKFTGNITAIERHLDLGGRRFAAGSPNEHPQDHENVLFLRRHGNPVIEISTDARRVLSSTSRSRSQPRSRCHDARHPRTFGRCRASVR
jgi:hypothetical protein